MKSLKGVSQRPVWNVSFKDTKEKKFGIEKLGKYDDHMVQSPSWNFIYIDTIKNFIILKNSSYRVKRILLKTDGKKDRI